jgi:hypothetical protein
MMEQLAERRMQREEDAQYAAASPAHQSMHAGHNHGPPLDDDDYDDEEDDYDSQDDEEYEEDEMVGSHMLLLCVILIQLETGRNDRGAAHGRR